MARGVASLVIRQCNFKRWQSHLVLLVMFGLTGKIGIAKPVAPTRRPCPSSRASRTVFPIISRVRSLLHPSRRTRSSRRRRSRHGKKNLRLLLPSPKPQPAPATSPENSEAVRSKPAVPVPNPVLRRASAPPPRILEAPLRKIPLQPTLKPKFRWNMRAPAMDPAPVANNDAEQLSHEALRLAAQNVIQMKPARPAHPPRMMPPPETPVSQNRVAGRLVAVSNLQADFFEKFAQSDETPLSKRRRKAKMRRFIACESTILAVLLPLAILGLSWPPDNVALVWIMNILTIASAVVAALLPIIFFAFTPTLPEIER
jgi:hypothetical protein